MVRKYYGDQIAMGKRNSGGPMFCEWKSDISKQSLGVCEFEGVADITYGASYIKESRSAKYYDFLKYQTFELLN